MFPHVDTHTHTHIHTHTHTHVHTQYDAAEKEQQAQTRKQVKLDKLEQEWKAEQQKSSGWWGWLPTVSFPSNVIANLQVSMQPCLVD